MSEETYVAVWGMSSLVVTFVAAGLCIIAAIWNAEMVARVFGSVIVVALFSVVAALFVQGAMGDRQAAKHSVSTPQPNVDEGDGK